MTLIVHARTAAVPGQPLFPLDSCQAPILLFLRNALSFQASSLLSLALLASNFFFSPHLSTTRNVIIRRIELHVITA